MGNQVSKKRINNKSVTTTFLLPNETEHKIQFTSQKTVASSYAGSVLSSNDPKFCQEAYPATSIEGERQQGEHYLLKYVFQASYFAPIEDVLSQEHTKVLDIGCGTQASWILDVANDFPQATFIGFDIIEPFSLDAENDASVHIPANCRLFQANVLDKALEQYEANSFDYVHQRNMHLVYHGENIPSMCIDLFRITKQGCWIELMEPDIQPKRAGPIFSKIMDSVQLLLKEKLLRVYDGSKLVKRMKEMGLEDIKTDYGSVPVCWGGYIGKLVYEDSLSMFHNIGPVIYEYLDLDGAYNKEAYDALLDSAFNECVEYQTFFNIRWAVGRKPSKP